METVIGVFASRERAEECVKQLLGKRVPQDTIIFLTRSESEAMTLGKSLGAYAGGLVGGAAGLISGVAAATMFSIPGIGQVFALGIGATAALGLAGSEVGKMLSAKPNLSLEMAMETPQPTPGEKACQDLTFFAEVLQEGRSLIVVRTDSQAIAKVAAGILDRMGISERWRWSIRMQTASRQIGDISVVEVRGRITVGEGNIMLREVVTGLVENGKKRIVLNLQGVEYVDSGGLGELVRTHTTLQKEGGQLKMANVNPRVQELLKVTSLHKVFDVHKDEASAVQSFELLAAGAGR
ncbi:MAG: STAS domain-containing protein [Candidatus Acidiferrales bacterium]|jgi:anti-sigma B factor antagonist